jgi:hypothetical protein
LYAHLNECFPFGFGSIQFWCKFVNKSGYQERKGEAKDTNPRDAQSLDHIFHFILLVEIINGSSFAGTLSYGAHAGARFGSTCVSRSGDGRHEYARISSSPNLGKYQKLQHFSAQPATCSIVACYTTNRWFRRLEDSSCTADVFMFGIDGLGTVGVQECPRKQGCTLGGGEHEQDGLAT